MRRAGIAMPTAATVQAPLRSRDRVTSSRQTASRTSSLTCRAASNIRSSSRFTSPLGRRPGASVAQFRDRAPGPVASSRNEVSAVSSGEPAVSSELISLLQSERNSLVSKPVYAPPQNLLRADSEFRFRVFT